MNDPAQSDGRPGSRALGLVTLAAVVLWLSASLPLLLGVETLFARDVFNSHLAFKFFGAQELRAGRIPYINPTLGLGQAFRGNPNALPLYPGNLVYLFLPFWIAFNLHYVLHWLLSLFTMRSLARALGLSDWGALLAGVVYAGCGFMLTNLSFYNLIAFAAWWPLVIACVVRSTRRSLGFAGVAVGLSVLSGEPVSLVLGIVPLLVIAATTLGLRRGVFRSAVALVIGALLALPQLIATVRVLGFTSRALVKEATSSYDLHPLRLLELFVPLPWGDPFDVGPGRFLEGRLADGTPFIYSLHFGLVAVGLALLALFRSVPAERLSRSVRGLGWMALASLGMAMFGKALEPALDLISAGLFRYPEKFLLWLSLAVPLLAGVGLDSMKPDSMEPASGGPRVEVARRFQKVMLVLLASSLSLLIAVAAIRPAFLAWLGPALSPIEIEHSVSARRISFTLSALFASGICGAALLIVRRRFVEGLVLLQLVSTLQLAPMVATVAARPFQEPAEWSERAGRRGVLMATVDNPFGQELPIYQLSDSRRSSFNLMAHDDLDYPTGVQAGHHYPLAPEFEGLSSPMPVLVRRNLPNLPWAARLNWLRILGVEHMTVAGAPPPSVVPLEQVDRASVSTTLVEIGNVAPEAWWPEAVLPASSPLEAFRQLSESADPINTVVVPREVQHRSGATILALEAQPDRIRVEVVSPGGVLVVRRAFNPLLEARTGQTALSTFPADLLLTGVEVPEGEHEVVLEVDKKLDRLAFGISAIVGLFCLWLIGGSGALEGQRTPRDHRVQ